MNQRIRDMIEQASLKEDRYALPDEFAEQFAEQLLRDVLDTLSTTNANRCVYTTHDQGILECARSELIKAVKAAYDVTYTYYPQTDRVFPVRSHGKK